MNATGHRGDERGFTSAWVLVLATLIVVFGVAAFDIWRVFSEQRELAAQADRAAAAGAQAINETAFAADPTNARILLIEGDATGSAYARALAQLQELGKEDDVEIVVTNPGPGQNSAPTVTVTVRREVKLSFFPTDQVVSATSTASPQIAK